MIALDYETYYAKDHSVSNMGPWAYAHHPDTEIYMVSVVGEGIEYVGKPEDFNWALLEGKDLVAHNMAFDATVTAAAIKRGIIPAFRPRSLSCTADLVAYHGLPRTLAGAVKAQFGHELPKIMRNFASGKKWADIVAKGKGDQMKEYALEDSRWCLKLWEALSPTWPAWERQLSAITRKLIWRGVAVDTDKLEHGIATLATQKLAAENKIPWRNDGKILSIKVLREYCEDLGVPAPKSLAMDSEDAQEWEDKYAADFEWVDALRTYRRTNMLLTKLQNIDNRMRDDGTMPVNLKYFGAHPGRWSGDAGVNLQNLPRGEMFGVNLRHMLIPKPGNRFVIPDLSQIEPRVLAWLSNDREFLDQIANGTPLYEADARARGVWTKPGPLKTGNPELYQMFKASRLGLGYGCGWKKFVRVAENMAGLKLEPARSRKIVEDWRVDNHRTVRLWRDLSSRLQRGKDARVEAIEYPLPSGRVARWWQPRADIEDPSSIVVNRVKGSTPNYTWGGKMAQNLCECIGRDIIAHHWLQAEKAGIPVTWTVHDELVCEVPEDQAEDALAELINIMSTPPDWIPDIPLAAEGSIETRYTK